MKKTILLFILILCANFIVQAQYLIEATVYDSISNQPLEYVNIGVLENTNGTVSNKRGNFSLLIKEENTSIRFSSIGYESKILNLQNLKSKLKIFLVPIVYDLESVQIKSKKFGEKIKRGRKIKNQNNVWGWEESQHLGMELGRRIKIKKESLLKSAHFGIHQRSPDSTLFRINIYEFKNGKVGKNLMPRNYFVYAQELKNYAELDLSDLNIVVKDDIILTLEIVEKESTQEGDWIWFIMKEKLWRTNVFRRDASQAEFYQGKENKMGMFKVHIGYYLMVKESQ